LLGGLAIEAEARYEAPMRHAFLCAILLPAAAASCGGSSSETPWPVEPEPSQVGIGPSQENPTPPSLIEDAGVTLKPRGSSKQP
jgi:hypothetical protein